MNHDCVTVRARIAVLPYPLIVRDRLELASHRAWTEVGVRSRSAAKAVAYCVIQPVTFAGKVEVY